MNRRLTMGVSAIAVAGMTLAGCAGGSSDEAASEATAEQTAAEETDMRHRAWLGNLALSRYRGTHCEW